MHETFPVFLSFLLSFGLVFFLSLIFRLLLISFQASSHPVSFSHLFSTFSLLFVCFICFFLLLAVLTLALPLLPPSTLSFSNHFLISFTFSFSSFYVLRLYLSKQFGSRVLRSSTCLHRLWPSVSNTMNKSFIASSCLISKLALVHGVQSGRPLTVLNVFVC